VTFADIDELILKLTHAVKTTLKVGRHTLSLRRPLAWSVSPVLSLCGGQEVGTGVSIQAEHHFTPQF
jgi:hypothetical protein